MFEAPRAAVDAAIAVQRQLLGRVWTDDRRVRVRIGIHSGYPTSTETNYIGMDVHTTSRICAVGHGEQIVVSGNTREAVKASAPDGVRFTSLGPYRFRGLPAAVPLYQVASQGSADPLPPSAEELVPSGRSQATKRSRRQAETAVDADRAAPRSLHPR